MHQRPLPWRNTKNPYKVWLSEIILQQTKVVQGLPYYLKFIDTYPTVHDLANAAEEEVLKLWQGLGYYSRARNLHFSAKMICDVFNGVFPKTYDEVIQLKGVGEYTASAVSSFCNNEKRAVVDGNVYRVLARIFGIFTPINSTEGVKQFKELAYKQLSKEQPAIYNQAIMEFGAMCCTPKKPNCMFCPFMESCFAYQHNQVANLPVKLKKTKVTKKYFYYLLIKDVGGKVLMHKREGKGIWQNLYQFPLVDAEKKISVSQLHNAFKEIIGVPFDVAKLQLTSQNDKPYKLTHQHIYAHFYSYDASGAEVIFDDESYLKVSLQEINDLPLPILIANFLEGYAFEKETK